MFDKIKKVSGQHIDWYCDNCGHHMNGQKGFNTRTGVWKCENCGYTNDVSRNNLNGNKVKKAYNEEVEKYYKSFEKPFCKYNDVITEKKFSEFVDEVLKNTKALKNRLEEILIQQGRVSGTVKTISGLNKWEFAIDFNYYGEITGNYRLNTTNDESDIPEFFAKEIQKKILDEYTRSGVLPPKPETPRFDNEYSCGHCGAQLNIQKGYNNNCMFWECKCCGTMNKLPLHYVRDQQYDEDDDSGRITICW